MTLILQNTTFIDASTEVPALGTNARLYDRSGTGQVLFSGVPNYNDANTGDLGVGSFKLIDNRDNKPYLVRRLADGNCWMVQNLDLNLADFAGTHNLTIANTDLNSSAATTRGYYDPQEKLMTSTLISGNTVAERLLSAYGFAQTAQFQSGEQRNTDVEPQYTWGSTHQGSATTSSTLSTDLGDIIFGSEYTSFARSYNNVEWGYVPTDQTTGVATSIADLTTRTVSDELMNYKDSGWTASHATQYVGDYYDWYAATAESGTYEMNSGEAEDSICSTGWQLPTATTALDSKSFYNLIAWTYAQNTSNGNPTGSSITIQETLRNIDTTPISLVRSGYYSSETGRLNNRGGEHVFWGSTAETNEFAYRMGMSYYTHKGVIKYLGASVRCVNRDDSAEQVASTCPSGSICYSGNGGTGSMANQTPTLTPNDDTDVVLTASTFTRLGYGFAGWNTQKNGFGTTYGPNETITITDGQLASEGLQLYAKWIPSTGTMQDFTTQQCTNLGIHQSIALTDSRDGNTYTVTKLKDNNCWMTQNLALNLADFAGTHNLTPANTDLNSTTAVNRGYWDPEEKAVAQFQTGEDFSSYTLRVLGQAQSVQFSVGTQDDYRWSTGDHRTPDIARSQKYNNGRIFYNWYAATAESGNANSASDTNMPDSICPKGWKLPIVDPADPDASGVASYYNLFEVSYGYHSGNAEEMANITKSPIALELSGYRSYSGGTVNATGNYFNSWTATAKSVGSAYNFNYRKDENINLTEDSSGKTYGLSVSCVKR